MQLKPNWYTFVKVSLSLGVYLDENLSGSLCNCEELVKKLNRVNGMLAKARHNVPEADLA